jgi:DNA ligase D-like protein (predicted ligase)/DNA ligase D-like protein (predicted polymerase)/DNA ligase D-like protein (predicted 3'-phosphoesterase)
MPRKSHYVQVGKRKFELSNLDKVLYPADGIIKAELVEYYLTMAPTILRHVKGRALSLVRYPDGIEGESFFQKNKPDWAPDWLESIKLGEEDKKDYPIATEEASLVWLANLACIELHQMHARSPNFDKPDYLVIDLDPPDDCKFPKVAEIAFQLKEHVETFGYHPFVKTTGRKGLHVVIPVEPKWTFEQVFEAAKAMAQPFVEKHSGMTTLHIQKEHRKGRVLIDIYRNRTSQSIVAAYSVRGLPGATVSTPLTWDELATVEHSREWNIHTVPERVLRNGDPWEPMDAFAVSLHTERKAAPVRKKLKPARARKTPDQLESYAKKREFSKTPEPKAELELGQGNAFVVHRHHASRLHYDLRLEKNGVLMSFAVPKGLPPRPGVKRLAVQTEDHPLEYVNFQGEIPKGEYGGGQMWIFAQGRYQVTKEKKDGFYFRLNARELTSEYRIHRMKENQWLLERVDAPQIDWLHDTIEPMLSDSRTEPPQSEEYLYEVKWDGIRALIAVDDGQLRILSRNGLDITAQFPELRIPEQAFRVAGALFDGEIVCLDETGRPVFKHVIHRMQQKSEGAIDRARAKHPAACYLFDLLYLDGRPVVQEPLQRRREWLQDVVRKDIPYRVSSTVEEGHELFEAARQMGLEGIMAKRRDSPYLPGRRSEHWLKIKTRNTIDVVVIGYTAGKGERESTFGALHVAQREGKKWRYLGKVGTGFDDKTMKDLAVQLASLKTVKRPIEEKPLDDAQTTWVEPVLVCEVQYASFTKDGMLREPVFVKLRPDI